MAEVTQFTTVDAGVKVLTNATAQADTGQEHWVRVPPWATYAFWDFNLTAVAGSTPIVTLRVHVYDFTNRDNASAVATARSIHNLSPSNTLTAAARVLWQLGPNITGTTSDTSNAGTGTSQLAFNVVLPPVIGFIVTLDRADGNETYTYSSTVWFR